MIYLDTSVVIAELFAEDRRAPVSIWREQLFSSRLLEYELWNRVHAKRAPEARVAAARTLLGRVSLAEMAPFVLARALEPFPTAVRTLDGLHLATMQYLSEGKQRLTLASLDDRMRRAAKALGYSLAF